jgi:hypothetical protein
MLCSIPSPARNALNALERGLFYYFDLLFETGRSSFGIGMLIITED